MRRTDVLVDADWFRAYLAAVVGRATELQQAGVRESSRKSDGSPA